MDATMQQVANLFGGGAPAQVIRDGLGTTHHESWNAVDGSRPRT